jgi:anti-anti-sigma factor
VGRRPAQAGSGVEFQVKLGENPFLELSELLEQVPGSKRRGTTSIKVSLARITLLDSMLVGLLVRLRLQCDREGLSLALVEMTPDVARTFAYSGVAELFGIQAPQPPVFAPRKK